MSHHLIDRQNPRVADLLRNLEKIGKTLNKLEPANRQTFKGDRFMTDSELSCLLKISRRSMPHVRAIRFNVLFRVELSHIGSSRPSGAMSRYLSRM